MNYLEKIEARLSRRIEELRERLEELTAALPNRMDAGYDDSFYARLTAEETDRVLPELLPTVQDVLTALRRAEASLWDAQCEARLAVRATAVETLPGQIVLAGFGDTVALKLAS